MEFCLSKPEKKKNVQISRTGFKKLKTPTPQSDILFSFKLKENRNSEQYVL